MPTRCRNRAIGSKNTAYLAQRGEERLARRLHCSQLLP